MNAPNQRRALAIIACATLTLALTLGIRNTMPIYISPINTATGLGLSVISFAYGVGQLFWGLTQPFSGMLALRFGNVAVLSAGAALLALGTALTPLAESSWAVILTVGVLSAGGAGLIGPSLVMAAINHLITPERRAMATSLVNAGGSLGQFVIVPIAQMIITGAGWMTSMLVLGATAAIVWPLARVLRVSREGGASVPGDSADVKVRDALRDPNFPLLAAGFFVCGFHVAFIATHLPGVVALCGLPPEVGAWSLALIGLFNVAGSLLIGWAMRRWRSKTLLALIYALRGLIVVGFLLAPKVPTTFFIFAALLGVTYLATVPPTAGLVAKFYGPRNMATLFGIVMLSHQVGAFIGAWLGGPVFAATGNYDWMWYADIALALVAALVNLPIREGLPPLRQPAVAAR
jgi:predicted MFS family arabinose efflux permease